MFWGKGERKKSWGINNLLTLRLLTADKESGLGVRVWGGTEGFVIQTRVKDIVSGVHGHEMDRLAVKEKSKYKASLL